VIDKRALLTIDNLERRYVHKYANKLMSVTVKCRDETGMTLHDMATDAMGIQNSEKPELAWRF
jgi:hypothetical protein